MPETQHEVYKQHREIQNKNTYLLLAIAASCIALSLKRTTDSKIVYSMIPLGLAVLCWGMSFFFGYHFLRCADAVIGANLQMLTLRPAPNREEVLAEGEKASKKYSDRARRSSKCQFLLLILGALFFICWHIIGMINATISPTG